ncbi:MAG: 2-dehydro-3-deoxyglucarate aldolase [Clostridiales Family XIII bacterium]|jgi:2-keto-3-deoxy-L-rhamnonate aldolase RhmA|nr:2-dehydro-3-deoxyglucarate aldolase [Clostridiales Family XIII bacterium]
MKMPNIVRERIESEGYALGAFVASGSAMNCECLALGGMDFVVIDAEHAQTDAETMVDMTRASEMYGMAALVRVYDPSDTAMMSRLLDVGIHGLMIPLVETVSQAAAIIDAVKFTPLGRRGANGGRGAKWGLYEDYTRQSNDSLYTIMQCETKRGVDNIDAICETPGLDCVFIGLADLSMDLGHPGDDGAAAVAEAVDTILAACRRRNVVPGIVTGSVDAAVKRLSQGFKLVTCMNDQVFFRVSSGKHIRAIREAAKVAQ